MSYTGAALVAKLVRYELDHLMDGWEGAGLSIPQGSRSMKAFALANPNDPVVGHPDAWDRIIWGIQNQAVLEMERMEQARWRNAEEIIRFEEDATYMPPLKKYMNGHTVLAFPSNPSKFTAVRLADTAILTKTKLRIQWTSTSANTGGLLFKSIVTPVESDGDVQATPDDTLTKSATYNGDSKIYVTELPLTDEVSATPQVGPRFNGQLLDNLFFLDHTDPQQVNAEIGIIALAVF